MSTLMLPEGYDAFLRSLKERVRVCAASRFPVS